MMGKDTEKSKYFMSMLLKGFIVIVSRYLVKTCQTIPRCYFITQQNNFLLRILVFKYKYYYPVKNLKSRYMYKRILFMILKYVDMYRRVSFSGTNDER